MLSKTWGKLSPAFPGRGQRSALFVRFLSSDSGTNEFYWKTNQQVPGPERKQSALFPPRPPSGEDPSRSRLLQITQLLCNTPPTAPPPTPTLLLSLSLVCSRGSRPAAALLLLQQQPVKRRTEDIWGRSLMHEWQRQFTRKTSIQKN